MKEGRMTAEKAKGISKENDPNAVADAILARVEKAAKDGKWNIDIRDFGFGSNVYYGGPPEWPSAGKQVIAELRKLGFEVDIRCEENQFVDIYLRVSWA